MNIIRILNKRLNSNLTPTNHESFNSTFFGNSNKYNRNVFVKVFDSVNKFNTENLITQQLSDRVLETFKINDDGLKYVLVMNDLNPIDLKNTVSIYQAYEMGVVLAKFHNTVKPFNGIKEENSYFSKTSEDIKKLENRTQKYKLTSLLKEFSNLQPLIENDLNENSNIVLHGDVGIRNFKIINGSLNLIDYERARLGPNYQDFIKLFFQDFKLNNSLISSFLKGYGSTSIHTFQLKSWTQQFLIFSTAIGIMKYTEKIKDEPFKKSERKC
ncbi:phosphotransferase [Lactobacillus helveticus]|uniref:phosphotransferase n=1 Tax=Lactobacillus helveticus TaxID=1587 RepID=UPI0021A2CA82|nr:phosphotransferase [Lactobacillus helveticus]